MIHWAFDSIDSHPDLRRGVPPAGLLGAEELQRLDELTVPKRRRDWLIGRYTLKKLLFEHLDELAERQIRLEDLEVRPASDGAPEVWFQGSRAALQVSISHSNGRAATALSRNPLVAVGIDLETVCPRSQRFVNDYFTNGERARLERAAMEDRDLLVTLFWSAKEAALKALRLGLTVSPKSVSCTLDPATGVDSDDWQPLQLSVSEATIAAAGADSKARLEGFWRPLGGQVLTLVTCTPRPGYCPV